MVLVPIAVVRQFNRPIVRQVHDAPVRVGEPLRRRSGTRAGLIQMKRFRPFVAEVELPVRVQREMLARRVRSVTAVESGASAVHDLEFNAARASAKLD